MTRLPRSYEEGRARGHADAAAVTGEPMISPENPVFFDPVTQAFISRKECLLWLAGYCYGMQEVVLSLLMEEGYDEPDG